MSASGTKQTFYACRRMSVLGKSGHAADITGTTDFDLACVKTHTPTKCRKIILHQGIEPSGVQYLRLSNMQFVQNVSTSAASAGVLTRPRPIAVIETAAIPQCGAGRIGERAGRL
jgi:hypothetical protein